MRFYKFFYSSKWDTYGARVIFSLNTFYYYMYVIKVVKRKNVIFSNRTSYPLVERDAKKYLLTSVGD